MEFHPQDLPFRGVCIALLLPGEPYVGQQLYIHLAQTGIRQPAGSPGSISLVSIVHGWSCPCYYAAIGRTLGDLENDPQ